MITPTQGQIEAAAKVLACHDKHIDRITQADINVWKAEAELALTAAAKAGEPYGTQAEIDHLTEQCATLLQGYRELEAITIERCAQAVWDAGGDNVEFHVTAIRALKD